MRMTENKTKLRMLQLVDGYLIQLTTNMMSCSSNQYIKGNKGGTIDLIIEHQKASK